MNLKPYKKEATEVIKLGLPIIISQLGIVAMGVADTMQVGSIEGKSAVSVAAAGLSNSVSFTIAIIGILTLGVVAPMISKAEAEDNKKEVGLLFRAVNKVAWQMGLATLGICLLLGEFLDKMGQEREVIEIAKPYNMLIALSMIPLFLFVSLRQLSDGLEKTRIAMVVTLSALILNIILNWGFINGIAFFPRLELLGAGLATLLSRIYMALALWWIIKREKHFQEYLNVEKESLKNLITKIYKIGLPSGFQGFFEVAVFAAAVVVIGWYGKYQQAAHQIAINMCSVTYMMMTGLASAGGIRVGHFWGLNDKKRILLAGNTALGLSAIFMMGCAIIFFTCYDFLIHLYTSDVMVVPIATTLLIIGGIFQISDGLQATALGILRGIAEVNVPTVITLFAYWGIGLPIGYVLAGYNNLNAAGVWLGLTAGLTASAILLCWRFYARVRKL